MEMKEFGPPVASLAPPLDPPMYINSNMTRGTAFLNILFMVSLHLQHYSHSNSNYFELLDIIEILYLKVTMIM